MINQEKIELIKKELFENYKTSYIYNHEIDDDYDVNPAVLYAEKCLDYFLKLEGPDRLFNSKEMCDGIAIGIYLDMIRNLKEEACLLIAISNYAIVGTVIFFGRDTMITFDDYERNGIYHILKKWNENNYKVLNYHNHPNCIAARPSNTDIININLSTTQNPNIKKALEKYNLINFEYYDWGIVTEFDFYSERQENKSKELIEEWENVEHEIEKLNCFKIMK